MAFHPNRIYILLESPDSCGALVWLNVVTGRWVSNSEQLSDTLTPDLLLYAQQTFKALPCPPADHRELRVLWEAQALAAHLGGRVVRDTRVWRLKNPPPLPDGVIF